MKKNDTIKEIINSKNKINSILHENHHKIALNYGLTIEQYHLLVEIDDLMLEFDDNSFAPTIGEIAKNIRNSSNTVSEKISRLENKGLLNKIKDSKDRRISRVVLTDKGRKLIDNIASEAGINFLFCALSEMEEEKLCTLLSGLKELEKNLEVKSNGL